VLFLGPRLNELVLRTFPESPTSNSGNSTECLLLLLPIKSSSSRALTTVQSM
jgi:hypothetical protein